MPAGHDDHSADVCSLRIKKCIQLILAWPVRQNQLISFRRYRTARARCPGEDFAGKDVFDRRNDVAGEALVQPADVTKLPGLEMSIRESPGVHLFDGPLGGGFMIRRSSQ